MSCIRGHRTTSCGIPVCRPKIFWTVKRPGRPSNACNCRYASTGGCRCVVAKTACPHKAKKGEKRSGECRCDEQGRFCCLIEAEQWAELMQLGKPRVVFYPTREGLEATFARGMSTLMSMPITPTTPGIISMPGTPGLGTEPYASSPSANGWQSPRAVLAPRFGMMDIGGQRSLEAAPDKLAWQTQQQAPLSPPRQQQHLQQQAFTFQQEQPACCSPAQPSQPAPQNARTSFSSPPQQMSFDFATPITLPTSSLPPPPPAASPGFDLDKLRESYLEYQFPSAICQTCGLNGCTCRNCPAVMQSFTDGCWAQCCGRKHARTAAYVGGSEEVRFVAQPQDRATPKSGCCVGAAGTADRLEESNATSARGCCCSGDAATEPATTGTKREAESSPRNGEPLYNDSAFYTQHPAPPPFSNVMSNAVPSYTSFDHQQHHPIPPPEDHQLHDQPFDLAAHPHNLSLTGLPPEFFSYDNTDPFEPIPGLLETDVRDLQAHDMDLSEFLLQDRDRPPEFHRDGGTGSLVDAVNAEDRVPAEAEEGGSGGCCCGGGGKG